MRWPGASPTSCAWPTGWRTPAWSPARWRCTLAPDRSTVAVDDDAALEEVVRALVDAGHDVLRPSDADYRDRLPDASLGVTRCAAAIADTGTMLLVFDRAHPRGTSLLPRIHLAVLHPGDFVPSLADALARFPAPPPSAVTFVTGPSRSADIEQILTLGVHGPAQVHATVPGRPPDRAAPD